MNMWKNMTIFSEHGLLQIMYNQGVHRQWETTNQKKKGRRSEQKKCTMKNEDYVWTVQDINIHKIYKELKSILWTDEVWWLFKYQ